MAVTNNDMFWVLQSIGDLSFELGGRFVGTIVWDWSQKNGAKIQIVRHFLPLGLTLIVICV